jgi:hypothetical protein
MKTALRTCLAAPGEQRRIAPQEDAPTMTPPASAASSTPLERDAQLISADDHAIEPRDIAIGVIIGRTSEFFDFLVYAIA